MTHQKARDPKTSLVVIQDSHDAALEKEHHCCLRGAVHLLGPGVWTVSPLSPSVQVLWPTCQNPTNLYNILVQIR